MKTQLVIWGASGHAKVVADIIQLRGEYEIAGFIDDCATSRIGESFCGSAILGGREALDQLLRDGVRHAILAFGNCGARLKLAEYLLSQGFTLISAIHPSAIVAGDVLVGQGTVVAAGAVINPSARIGANVIINTSASIDHDAIVEDGAHICPGVHLAGDVMVGKGAWIGIGSSVIEKIRIGDGAVVGAGSVVVAHIPPHTLSFGVPAKVIKRTDA